MKKMNRIVLITLNVGIIGFVLYAYFREKKGYATRPVTIKKKPESFIISDDAEGL